MTGVPAGVLQGPDGRSRCPWPGLTHEDYRAYHDQEWGHPVHGERAVFERLSLEAFQAGLSWLTILRKRPAFRAAFAGFDPEVVAGFGPDDVVHLLGHPGIVRNRRKIEATVDNARATLRLREQGGLDRLFWSARPVEHRRPAHTGELCSLTPESCALATDLKRSGFAYVGPTTAYAAMQACGVVDDHLAGCFRAGPA